MKNPFTSKRRRLEFCKTVWPVQFKQLKAIQYQPWRPGEPWRIVGTLRSGKLKKPLSDGDGKTLLFKTRKKADAHIKFITQTKRT